LAVCPKHCGGIVESQFVGRGVRIYRPFLHAHDRVVRIQGVKEYGVYRLRPYQRRTWTAKARIERKPTHFVIFLIVWSLDSARHLHTMINTLLLEVAIVGRRFGGVRGITGLVRPLLLLGAGPKRSLWSLRTDVVVLGTDKFLYKHSSSQRTVP
jgi:hypothetical protein